MGKFGNVLESACMTNPTKESGSQVSRATKGVGIKRAGLTVVQPL
jgi:hypothetical protein